MGKKKERGGKSVQNLELYQRLNFLHQASTLLTHLGPQFAPLSRSLGRDLDSVRKRSTLRADPTVKRQYCKQCHGHLTEGLTLHTRLTRTLMSGRRRGG
ncbi:MAG: hypothetical protein DHS80DRAFT_20451 [Piptocephalis tieghemiana]|nr:MAG: hypothetical protein DHS80DRAFT_20451 [Piptocephalis tieghemiana]